MHTIHLYPKKLYIADDATRQRVIDNLIHNRKLKF